MTSVKREGSPLLQVYKRSRRSSTSVTPYDIDWADWPAPSSAMQKARQFILDIIDRRLSVLLVPDKDADGLSAGSLMHRTLTHLGHPPDLISVHHLSKGTNVHSDAEMAKIASIGSERVIVLDQGSRPGKPLVPIRDETRVLIIDHHMSNEWPEGSLVLTACHTPPIATAALLTYMLLRDMHPAVRRDESWRAVVGVVGDLGPGTKWGTPPWPAELGIALKNQGAKTISDAVAGINAPRRTAEYNVPKAWDIFLNATGAKDLASNAFLKLCKLDAGQETERWARTPPKFSIDGRVAVITVHTGFQVHPVIATRWAGNLGKKSKKLVMVMCANTGFNPDPNKVSFSCRIASGLRSLPDKQRPNLIELLLEYGRSIEGFLDRVGGDYARGHNEATGGIIPKSEFSLLLTAMGVVTDGPLPRNKANPKGNKHTQTKDIKDFFRTLPVQNKS